MKFLQESLFAVPSSEKELFKSLKQILGFNPKNLALYNLAFIHKSIIREAESSIKLNNERLEFLGDAILSAVIAHYLFKKYPYKDEGFLTEMRSKIVSRAHLNRLAVKLGIDRLIKSNLTSVSKSIYGDAFEALIGAVYLDKGYKKVEEFILNRILKYHVNIEELLETEINFKGKLLDWTQKEKKDISFKVIDESGEDHKKTYNVQIFIENEGFGKGMDLSKKKAEQRAAEQTCRMLKIS